jgi:hypothetical protein
MTTNETVCEKWLFCALGMATVMDCPFGQVFSTDKNQCAFSGLVSQPCGFLPVGIFGCNHNHRYTPNLQWRR